MINIIRIQLNSDFNSKLSFVKLIKDCTGLGLKDSKELCDDMQENLRNGIKKFTEVKLKTGVDVNILRKGMADIDVDAYVIGGLVWERNFKILSLGIGEEIDFSDFIVDYVNSIDRERGKDIVGLMVGKLSKEDLSEIFSKISKEIYYDSNL